MLLGINHTLVSLQRNFFSKNKINMNQYIAQFAIVVNDYDEAIDFYTKKLNFKLIEDTFMSETKRWVVVRPAGDGNCSLLLARADGAMQQSRVGNQTGGRVFIFLYTDDILRDEKNLIKHNIKIVRPLNVQPHGKVLVFEDLYGNLWDLIEK